MSDAPTDAAVSDSAVSNSANSTATATAPANSHDSTAPAGAAAASTASETPSGVGKFASVLIAVVGSLLVVGGLIYAVEWLRDDQGGPKTIETPEVVLDGPLPAVEVVGGTVHNFGEMSVGETGEHTYVLKNTGEAPLELKGGKSTCKCTLSDLKIETLQPGESTEITLEYTPKGEGKEWRQQAVVHTNVPGQESVLLEVEGAVLRETYVFPEGYWQVGPVAEDEPVKVGGHIFSSRRDDLTVVEIASKPDWTEVVFEPAVTEELASFGARSGVRVEIRVSPKMPVGRFNDVVALKTNLEGDDGLVEIGIAGSRSGPITMIGTGFVASEMTMRVDKPISSAKGVTKKVTMLVKKSVPFDLLDYTASDEHIKVEWEKDDSFKSPKLDRYVMTVRIEPGLRPGWYDHDDPLRFTIETSHPDAQSLPMLLKVRVTP